MKMSSQSAITLFKGFRVLNKLIKFTKSSNEQLYFYKNNNGKPVEIKYGKPE